MPLVPMRYRSRLAAETRDGISKSESTAERPKAASYSLRADSPRPACHKRTDGAESSRLNGTKKRRSLF